jgi:hypothetical protein
MSVPAEFQKLLANYTIEKELVLIVTEISVYLPYVDTADVQTWFNALAIWNARQLCGTANAAGTASGGTR